MLTALFKGPAAYVARSGWPAWAVLPAAVVIFALAAIAGIGSSLIYTEMSGIGAIDSGFAPAPDAQYTMPIVVWLGAMQIGVIVFTILAAGFFSSKRSEVLALVSPAQGWGVLVPGLVLLLAATGVWTGVLLNWKPEVVAGDLKPFYDLIHSDAVWFVVLVIVIGAPLSEELLFRGFLFSALAKTRLGLIGTSVVTAGLWTALHAGYSIFGLIEVMFIGLYFSWLLVRTGSLWVTILCHGIYNAVVVVILASLSQPL